MKYALAALLWLGASGAQASDAPEPCAPEVELRSIHLDYRGTAGVWFDARVAKCVLEEVKLGRALQGLVADHEQKDLRQAELTSLLERQLALALEEAARARTGMETAIQLQGDAERKLGAPGRSRALWFALGVIAGIGVVAVSAYAVTAATR